MIRQVLLVALVVVLLCQRASAYNENGHRVIALMAYEVLEMEARAKVIALLRHHPRFRQDFRNKMPDGIRNGSEANRRRWLISQAGVWPDIARGFPGRTRNRFHRPSWHYINKPFFATEEHEHALASRLPELEFSITRDLDDRDYNIAQAIKNSIRIIENRRQPKSLRAVHVCWLVHTVADIHQALHTTALFSPNLFPEGDRGGNEIRTRQGKLHSIWDGRLGRGRSFSQLRRDAREMLNDEDLNACGNACTENMDLEAWVDEGHEIAATFAYTDDILEAVVEAEENDDRLERIQLPGQYFRDAGRVNRERAVLAAFRLALLLDSAVVDEEE
ncbi:MAG: S1/P1 nuclease [Phycisphaerales bacterium]|nr:S1/P1 nuclease [Phycisphaerales bacterium]